MSPHILQINRSAQQLPQILNDRRVNYHGKTWLAIPSHLDPLSKHQDNIVFELFQFEKYWKPSFWKILLRALRVSEVGWSWLPIGVILLQYSFQGGQFLPGFLTWLFSIVGFQVSFMLWIQAQGACPSLKKNATSTKTLFSKSVIQQGWVSPRQMKHWAGVMLIIACGFLVVGVAEKVLWWKSLALSSLLLTWSCPEFEIKMTQFPLSTLFFFLLTGPALTYGVHQGLEIVFDFQFIVCVGVYLGFAKSAVIHATLLTLGIDRSLFQRGQRFLWLDYFGALSGWVIIDQRSIFSQVSLLIALWSVVEIFFLLKNLKNFSGPWSPKLGSLRQHALRIYMLLGLAAL